MKKIVFKIVLGLAVLASVIFGLSQVKCVRNYLDNYAVKQVEEFLGSKPLKPEYEAIVVALAQEMGITEHIVIRKMNATAMQMLGYHNAFVIFPKFAGIIPISSQPMLYVSEGMFEDLTYPEQRFLIGHELIHARDRHLLFAHIVHMMIILLLLGLAYLVFVYLQKRYQISQLIRGMLVASLLAISLGGEYLGFMFYRRHIEQIADTDSLKLLNSYEGFFSLNKRWQKEFCIPKHNVKFFGLLAGHPSCHEREQLCLELQKKYNIETGC